MRRIPKLNRFRRRENRGRWSEARVRELRDEVFETAWRAGVLR